MSFTYTGNQLKKIDDNGSDLSYEGAMDFSDGSTATTEYTWDKNSNMTRDLNRKISKIGYNSLNLPETITYTDGHKVMNSYDCLGRKVSVIYQVSVPSVTTPQADGTYHHYIKDYQGNNVLTIEENAAGVESNHWDYNLYYPYGCPTRSIYSDRYMYSGKELDNMNGLRLYDFPARPYDAISTRFLSPDPLRSKYPHISPYAYCANNPIMFIDPNGMEIWINDINYTIGMSYSGTDDFIKNTIMALNTIAECGGESLISDLIKSEKRYNYKKTSKASSYANPLGDGNIEIGISSSLTDHSAFYSAVAHETMHSAQFEHGQGGRSIFNEVEAYVFESVMSTNSLGDCPHPFFSLAYSANETSDGKSYINAFENLTSGYDMKSMAQAIISFKKGRKEKSDDL